MTSKSSSILENKNLANGLLRLASSLSNVMSRLTMGRLDADWKESEHPRDETGKFAPYKVTPKYSGPLDKAGFSKSKGTNKLTYAKGGEKFVFDPPEKGAKQSSSWTHYKGLSDPSPTKGYGSKAFWAHMQENFGAHVLPADIGQMMSGELAKAKKHIQQLQAAAQTQIQQTLDTQSVAGGVKMSVTAKGATPLGLEDVNGKPHEKYEMPGSGTLWVGDQGTWTLATPGYPTKQGNGAQALDMLLSGKKHINPPWKNVPTPHSGTSGVQTQATTPQQQNQGYSVSFKPPKIDLAGLSQKLHDLAQHAPTPDEKEYHAVSAYTGSSYSPINKALRHDEAQGHYKDTIEKITEYLDKASLPEDTTVYRKVSGEYAKILKSILIEGSIFQDKGFVSTAVEKGVWSGDLTWSIKAPKGSKGAVVAHMSQHKGEKEMLFQRGTKFKVNKITGDHYELEIVP